MERLYTGKEHIAAVFRRERTDRVPVRVFHGLRPGLRWFYRMRQRRVRDAWGELK